MLAHSAGHESASVFQHEKKSTHVLLFFQKIVLKTYAFEEALTKPPVHLEKYIF